MFAAMFRTVSRAFTLLHLATFATACGGTSDPTDPLPAPNAVAAVAVDNPEVDLLVNGSFQVTAVVRGYDGRILAEKEITWSTSRPDVALVDGVGRITGVAVGNAVVSAASEGKMATVQVSVFAPSLETRTVAIEPGAFTLDAGLTRQVSAKAFAANGSVVTGRAVAWETTNPAVATVDQNGRVTARGPGSARIVARIDGYIGISDVTVPAFAVWKLSGVNGQALPALLSIQTVIGTDGVARYARTMVLAGRMTLSVGNGRYQQDITTETIIEGMYSVPSGHTDLGNVSYLWPGDGLRFESTLLSGVGFDGMGSSQLIRTRQKVAGQGESGVFDWGR